MKRITISIISLLICLSVFGQTDIRKFKHMSPTQISKTLGLAYSTSAANAQKAYWDEFEYTGEEMVLRDSATKEIYDPGIGLYKSKNGSSYSYTLSLFVTSKPEYLFLTNYINGGVKVGDKLSKVKNFNFANTKYGRNKAKNNCTFDERADGYDYYIIFGEEMEYILLEVENGTITTISYQTKDDLPYENYDLTIKMW